MKLRELIKHKGSNVLSISADATLVEAARQLTQHRIGAMIILDDDNGLIGILSERDVAKAFGQHGAAATNIVVSAVMSQNVITCRLDHDILELFRIMVDNNIRHLPAVDNGTVIGMLSIRDISRALVDQLAGDNSDLKKLLIALSPNAA